MQSVISVMGTTTPRYPLCPMLKWRLNRFCMKVVVAATHPLMLKFSKTVHHCTNDIIVSALCHLHPFHQTINSSLKSFFTLLTSPDNTFLSLHPPLHPHLPMHIPPPLSAHTVMSGNSNAGFAPILVMLSQWDAKRAVATLYITHYSSLSLCVCLAMSLCLC